MLPLCLFAFGSLPWRPVADEESCAKHLLTANVFEDAKDPQKLGIYADCVMLLRHAASVQKHVHAAGVHYPTLVVSQHQDPAVLYDAFRDGAEVPHTFVLPAFDLNIGHAIKLVGTHNIRQSYEMQSLLRPGDGFVDCGANLGAYVIPMAERVGRAGVVVAFEPFRHVFQQLTANVALNGLLNVHTVPAALSSTSGRRIVSAPRMDYFNTLGAMRVDGQIPAEAAIDSGVTYDGEEDIQIWALDDFLRDPSALPAARGWISFFDEDRPGSVPLRLIKIDVEGMEKEVIEGARATIAAQLPIVWAENVGYFDRQDLGFIAVMHELGYACGKSEAAPQDLICTEAQGRGHQP